MKLARAIVARGLAPSSRSGASGSPNAAGSRVARTRSTMYSLTAGAIRIEAASERNARTSVGPYSGGSSLVRVSESGGHIRNARQVQHAQLGFAIGVADHQLHQEAVELGLRKRVGPLVLDRVLGRQHPERLGQRNRLVANRDLALLHRLEERA